MSREWKPKNAAQAAAANEAWRIVGEVERGKGYLSPTEIGKKTGITAYRVRQMIARFRLMRRAGIEPTGDWWHDRVNVSLTQADAV